MLENFPKASDLPLFIALAAAPACGTGKIPLDGDTAVEPADIQLDEGDTDQEANVLTAGEDGQDMGCISLTTAVNAQIESLVAMNRTYSEEDSDWVEPAGFYGDRNATLYLNEEEIATVDIAGSNGDLRFDMTSTPAELEAGTAYDLCIVGNPGENSDGFAGEFTYIVNQDGVIASTDLGSETVTFPLRFQPSFIIE